MRTGGMKVVMLSFTYITHPQLPLSPCLAALPTTSGSIPGFLLIIGSLALPKE